ncbi:MAG: ABC transporter substrate-binding protein, partial [Deltaproteobacteria bacterium]
MYRRAMRVGWVAVALCVVLAFAVVANAAEPFRIGVSVPLTGIFGKAGNLVKDAYTLWMEKVNAKGGINGHPVKLIFYDDKSSPPTSAKLVEKLIVSDKVDLLLGGYGSSLVFAGSAVAEKNKYPMISGGASSNKL